MRIAKRLVLSAILLTLSLSAAAQQLPGASRLPVPPAAPEAAAGAGAAAPGAHGSPPAGAPARPKVAVVLSGGSALGISHIGVLKVIEEAGIPIDMIVGTSMGAVVGGLYAAGYSPDQMAQIVTHLDWSSVFSEKRDSPGDRYDLLKRSRFPLRIGFDSHGLQLGAGLLDGQNVLALFTELTLQDMSIHNFDDLPVPYRAVAVDITSGKKVVISQGSLADAMRASMSIPGVFRPYEIDGRRLVDGGIVDNLPVDVAKAMGATIIIAVDCNGAGPQESRPPESGLSVAARTLRLLIDRNLEAARKEATLVISPDLSGFNVASYGDARALVARGEAAARADYPALRRIAEEIAATRPLVVPAEEPNRAAYRPLPVISGLQVEGGSSADDRLVEKAFAGQVGATANRERIRVAINSLYATGHYDFVKLRLESESGSPGAGRRDTAVVSLVPDTTPDDAIFFGSSFHAVFSTVTSNESEVLAGAIVRDLSGKGSALYVEGGFLNKQRAYVEYFQPVGPFFLMPYFKYEAQFDSYYLTKTNLIYTLYKGTGGGVWSGAMIGRHLDLMAGYFYQDLMGYGVADPGASNLVSGLSGVFRADTMSTSVFPERGFSTLVRARWADPQLGGNTSFTTLEWNFDAALPIMRRLTLGIAGYAAADLSDFFNIGGDLPPELDFTIRQPGMFYGLPTWPAMGLGDDVDALALELRAKVATLSPIVGGDLFAIANLSAAVVNQGTGGSIDPADFLPIRWDGSLGLGLRLTQHTGVLVMAGLVDDGDQTLSPQRLALSIDFGTLTKSLEDRR